MTKELALLSGWIKTCSNVVIFSGAGMSTESGLADFRSKDGMWKNIDPRQLASVRALHTNTKEFYEFYRLRVQLLREAKPHEGHLILADWEKRNKIRHIITQNVDGFHHQAGSRSVSELHGSLGTSHCQDCGAAADIEFFMQGDIPKCGYCSGKLRPGVILFGESLPLKALEDADKQSANADLFIVIGSSLEVSPANYFPVKAKNSGARLAIINLEETHLDDIADIIIRGKAKEVLKELDGGVSRKATF